MSITKPNHFRKCKLHTADRELQLVRRIQLEFKTTTNNRRRCTPTDPTILPSQSFIQWQMHFSKYVHITTHVTHYTTLQSALTASPSLPPHPALMRNRRARTGFWWKWISSSSLYTLLFSSCTSDWSATTTTLSLYRSKIAEDNEESSLYATLNKTVAY